VDGDSSGNDVDLTDHSGSLGIVFIYECNGGLIIGEEGFYGIGRFIDPCASCDDNAGDHGGVQTEIVPFFGKIKGDAQIFGFAHSCSDKRLGEHGDCGSIAQDGG
jgi:hypothetical protein